jgi:hypothetical protein
MEKVGVETRRPGKATKTATAGRERQQEEPTPGTLCPPLRLPERRPVFRRILLLS